MVLIDYNTDRNILKVELIGRIGLEEMKDYWRSVIKDHSLPRSLYVLEDATNAKFDFDIDDVNQIIIILGEQIQNYKIIKHAMLHSKPLETAYGMMQVFSNDYFQYTPKVFSTSHRALEWLAVH